MKRVAFFAPILFVAAQASAAEQANQPPKWNQDYDDTQRVKAGEYLRVRLEATDPDDAALSFQCRNLPLGAKVHVEGKTALEITWQSKKTDHGSWDVECDVSDGKQTDTKLVHVVVEDDWQSFFIPGASFSMLQPVDRVAWGTFTGVSTEILVASWIHRNENRGPSHGRVYLDMDILKSSRSGIASAFDLMMGVDMSLERNPTRKFLLPYFGIKTGAFIQKDLTGESPMVWHLTPLVGTYLWADQNVFVTASAGYMLPINAARFEDLRGLRANVGLNFSLW